MSDLDESPQAREDFFLRYSLTRGRPAGLGAAMQRVGTAVGNKSAAPRSRVPDGYLSAAAKIAAFAFAAGEAKIAPPGGDVSKLYKLYLEWYERNEPK